MVQSACNKVYTNHVDRVRTKDVPPTTYHSVHSCFKG